MIDKTAIIDGKAKISETANIGPFVVIGPNVKIGDNVTIFSHVNISGNTEIGDNNKIFPFASLGAEPQDLKYKGEENKLVIGNDNIFREYVTINPGTKGGGGVTKIGNNCLFMVHSHVAHDCIIGNNIVLANSVQVGGHVHIRDEAIIGGSCAIHQYSRIGQLAMIGGMTGIINDVIPYGLSMGNRNYLNGLNLIGLRRKNIPRKEIKELSDAYNIIFKNEKINENISFLSEDLKNNLYVKKVLEFINENKKRPICTPFTKRD